MTTLSGNTSQSVPLCLRSKSSPATSQDEERCQEAFRPHRIRKQGKVTTPFTNADSVIRALMLQLDGKIVAVGTEIVNGGGPANLVAARYLGK